MKITPTTRRAMYVRIAKRRQLQEDGFTARTKHLHAVEPRLKRAAAPKKQVDR